MLTYQFFPYVLAGYLILIQTCAAACRQLGSSLRESRSISAVTGNWTVKLSMHGGGFRVGSDHVAFFSFCYRNYSYVVPNTDSKVHCYVYCCVEMLRLPEFNYRYLRNHCTREGCTMIWGRKIRQRQDPPVFILCLVSGEMFTLFPLVNDLVAFAKESVWGKDEASHTCSYTILKISQSNLIVIHALARWNSFTWLRTRERVFIKRTTTFSVIKSEELNKATEHCINKYTGARFLGHFAVFTR